MERPLCDPGLISMILFRSMMVNVQSWVFKMILDTFKIKYRDINQLQIADKYLQYKLKIMGLDICVKYYLSQILT